MVFNVNGPVDVDAPTSISRLRLDDLPSLLSLSQQAGWPHTSKDWRSVLECGTGYGHRWRDKVISCVHITDYGPCFASLGLMLVSQAFRKQGLGSALMRHVVSNAVTPPTQSIGLIAGANVSTFYEPFGFRVLDEHILILRKVPAATTRNNRPKNPNPTSLHLENTFRFSIPITGEHLQPTLDFDREATQMERSALMSHRLRHSDRSLLVGSDDSETADSSSVVSGVHGYGMANVRREHLSVGPLVSTSSSAALDVTSRLTENYEGPIRIDVYESQHTFIEELKGLGYQVSSRQPVMIKGPLQNLPGSRQNIYCPASQAWT
jgi:GNAT superfamily N-acetyltransferase